jgi:hypothetical protein
MMKAICLLNALSLVAFVHADDAGIAFFESKVRPILVERCYECHSAEKKIKGGLLLDSRAGWQKGGDTGPALVPGAPDDSLLIKAVLYGDPDLSMPPKKRLNADEVNTLVQWVRLGAPDPRESTATKTVSVVMEERRRHWAYQPVSNPPPPMVRDAAWPRNNIDRFILARMEAEGQRPNPPASERTLIRRAHFDLLGLPPTFEEAEGQLDIGALLARPAYGQRWARHWLDVARYADTIEQSVDGERRIPFAHTYRDYVVDALNADKPFDRFILEQIAADRIEGGDLRALGFLTVGRRFRSNAEASWLVLDDRIDTVGRGFLGMTVACARCHDHKFDPVPTADYYSLAGILGSIDEPLDLPEVRVTGDEAGVTKYRAERAKILGEYEAHIDDCMVRSHAHFREFATEYLQHHVRSSANHRTTEGYVPLDTPRGLLFYEAPGRWSALLAKCRNEPFFRLWHQLIALRREHFATHAAPILAAVSESPVPYHPLIVAAFRGKKPASMLEVATTYGEVIAAALKSDTADGRYVVDLVFGPKSPVPPRDRDEMREDLHRFLNEKQICNRKDGERADGLRDKLAALEATAPVERARIVRASAKPFDPYILIRGDMKLRGAAVPRRFLSVLASVDDRSYHDDGRLQLAQAIANSKNPLTARVIVNRVWQHHFGKGLVTTPDDFGAMGAKPTHPELLDHLASWFVDHGWSLKELHRYILNSATWRQSAPPRRLEFEPLRDSLLAVAGKLDARSGGPSALLSDDNTRRALYGYTDRFRIPALMRNFDVANPDTSISQRAETLVPLQALYLLNSPFVRQQAEALALRLKAEDPGERCTELFRIALSRNPSAEEAALALDFIRGANERLTWTNLAQNLLLSNEFTFVD